jgi:hypothetical protein
MGAWGSGSFDNDTAMDWVSTFLREGPDAVREAFDAVTDEYLDADIGCCVIAAAEALAAARGKPVKNLPDGIKNNLGDLSDEINDDALLAKAKKCVQSVRDRDELHDLWEDADPTQWVAGVDDLLKRLR